MSYQQPSLRSELESAGYVLIPQVLSASSELDRLRAACHNATSHARAGDWSFVRTLPKQFPPWPSKPDPKEGIWGVQHLLHPDMPDSSVFAESYFDEKIINAVTEILGIDDNAIDPDQLVMELYNLLVRPDRDFALRWHRDDVPPSVSADEEEARLNEPILHTQWNLALYDDESLIVVPGSHARARTDAERNADPFEDNMPGQLAVRMKAGDVVFYNNNILHRGVYSSTTERMTLHGSMGLAAADPARARNVLQHGVGEWVDRCDFTGLHGSVQGQTLSHVAERMKANLVAMGSGTDVGFSQIESLAKPSIGTQQSEIVVGGD